MEGLRWYFENLYDVFLQGILGQFSANAYITIIACLLITFVALPFLLWYSRKQQRELQGFTDELGREFGGGSIDDNDEKAEIFEFVGLPSVELLEENGTLKTLNMTKDKYYDGINFFKANYEGHQFIFFTQAPSIMGGNVQFHMSKSAVSASYIYVFVNNNKNISFDILYQFRASQFRSKQYNNKFRKENLQISGQEQVEKIISISEIANYLENINFTSSPAFQLKLQGDKLILHIDKTSRKIDFWKYHVDFLSQLAKKIETI